LKVGDEIEDCAGNECRCYKHEVNRIDDVVEDVESFGKHICGGAKNSEGGSFENEGYWEIDETRKKGMEGFI